MPIRYAVFASEGLLFGVGTGSVNNRDLAAIAVQVLADPEFRLSFNEVWDFRDAVPEQVTFDGLFSLVQTALGWLGAHDPEGPPRAKCALVVASEQQFGLARMYQSLSENLRLETEIFRDPAEALRWVGAPGDWEPRI